MKTILVTGATGLLGSFLIPFLKTGGYTVVTHARTGKADLLGDLANIDDASLLLTQIQPSLIINLVGLTSVERCQLELNAAYLANTLTVENLVHSIVKSGAKCHLVQISTDHVYDGTGLHRENQVTLTNNYAFSKYAGELAAARVSSTILRTNFVGRSRASNRESLTDWVYTSLTNGKHVQALNDVLFSPLSMITLAEMILVVIERKPVGIFNLGSRNGMSKADFDFAFAERLGLQTHTMSRINIGEATFLKAYRPRDMRMDCSKFEDTIGVKMPNLIDEIERVRKEYHDFT